MQRLACSEGCFALDQPIPHDLIADIVKAWAEHAKVRANSQNVGVL
jgi:hypothetical protein